jgi:hypothetical protein
VINPRSHGVLDAPPEPVIGLAEGETRWRGMTTRQAGRGDFKRFAPGCLKNPTPSVVIARGACDPAKMKSFAKRSTHPTRYRCAQLISYTDTLSAMPLNATCLGVGFSPLLSSSARASAFSTTDSVTMIEREAATPWTREAMFTVCPK